MTYDFTCIPERVSNPLCRDLEFQRINEQEIQIDLDLDFDFE